MKNKTSIFDSVPLGAAALVLAVIIGLFGIGGAKVKSLGKKANDYYNTNISADMQLRINDADILVQQGEQVLDKNDAALKSAQDALKAIKKADTSGEVFAANSALTASMGQLYETMRLKVSDDKGSVLETTWADFLSRQNIIDFNYMDDYNALAQSAQKAASGFPASMLAKLVGFSV